MVEPAFCSYGGVDAAGLRVVGELDLGSRERLRTLLVELGGTDVSRLWLDLEGVTFIDCGCMAELEHARRNALAVGRQLELTGASPTFLHVAALAAYDELAAMARRVVRPD